MTELRKLSYRTDVKKTCKNSSCKIIQYVLFQILNQSQKIQIEKTIPCSMLDNSSLKKIFQKKKKVQN